MKPAAIIVTYMTRQDWKGEKFPKKIGIIFFNLCLFLFQFIFMVVGTAIGKIKWPKALPFVRKLCTIGIIITSIGIIASAASMNDPLFFFHVFMFINFIAEYRGIDWRRVWRAAQASHVRLVLEKVPERVLMPINSYWTANFGYPFMEIQPWRESWNDGKRFEYRDPTFEPTPLFIERMIKYAHDQEGKGYDDLQLISNGLHLVPWIVYPPCWGKELKIIKALNRKGGREQCISGVTACLRWAEPDTGGVYPGAQVDRTVSDFIEMISILATRFFKGYSTATMSPCLAVISKNWEKVKQ